MLRNDLGDDRISIVFCVPALYCLEMQVPTQESNTKQVLLSYRENLPSSNAFTTPFANVFSFSVQLKQHSCIIYSCTPVNRSSLFAGHGELKQLFLGEIIDEFDRYVCGRELNVDILV
jgi:hypothetical protein